MKKLLLTIIGSAFIAVAANAVQLGDKLLLIAKLTGDQEVPAVTTPGIGVASFLLNGAHDSLCVNVTFTGFTSAVTGAHIHAGAPGIEGPVIKDLSSSVTGNSLQTVIYGNDLKTHFKELLSGQLYINIHTNLHADGEIRGQIHLETDWGFVANMNGAQVVPATTTSAYGLGFFNISKDSTKIRFHIVAEGISGAITEARLNFGATGKNGAIALPLTSFISGNSASGVINNPTHAFIDSLLSSKVYIDLSTALHPNGTELRGQLLNDNKSLYFGGALNGLQQTPPVATTGGGVASIKLNPSFDTLSYDIVVSSLSTPITAVHFHFGAPGVAGAVEVDLGPAVVGNRITGKLFAPTLTPALINKFLRGDIYANVHTTTYPNGEIRGQVYRLARQGYTVNLTGAQEVPAVTTNAKASGIVSIDREGDNVHFMLVANGLIPTAAHFHKNVAGQVGNPIFDLAPYIQNGLGVFGYWRSSNTINPFTPAFANAFDKDSIYVNVHTTANPNGEIRGQVIKRGECFKDIPTGIKDENNAAVQGIVLYPNPSSDLMNITFNADKQSNVSLEVIDVLGKQVYTENFTAQNGNNLRSVFVNKFKNGLYMVKIQIGTTLTIERFVKN